MALPQTRRDFLKHSGSTGVLAAAATLGAVHVGAADDKLKNLRLGLIGCGSIMKLHTRGLVKRKGEVTLSWLCDVDPAQINALSQLIPDDFQSSKPGRTSEYEDVLTDEDVDAVIIATPHQWHAPITLAALKAGKDVYIEKPISHVFSEGPIVMAAAQKYGRVVQHGSQMRNSPVTAKARKLLDDGIIGEVKVARAWTAEPRGSVAAQPDGTAPQGVNYDRWLGPAPEHAFNPLRFHQSWRMFKDYSNGEIGDDGIHDLDMARWGLGIDELPVKVTARGGMMHLKNHAGEYPDNMNVTYEYSDGRVLVYENYPFTAYGMHGFDNGNVFYGTEGYMVFSRRGAFSTFLGQKEKPGPTEGREIRGQRGYDEHMTEFLNAVRANDPNVKGRPEVAHLSCCLTHFGNIAYEAGGSVEFDTATNRFVDNDAANAMLTKQYREPFGLPIV